ncbi:MAG: PepSY domain-containing protein [Chitinophagaceae bacterium]|nr:PepSY domain-containing protein [Chitinophagaceae bacterium]
MALLKKINAWLHLWLGLVSGIVVVILGITGCILVFEQEIKSISAPWLHVQKPANGSYLPPSALYKEVKKIFPEKEIRSAFYYGAERTVRISMNSDTLVYINPYTAEIAAMVDHEDFFHFIEEGHFHLWLPEAIGGPIVGWATFIFFILLITGLILWWPKNLKRSSVNKSFKIKWRAKFKRVNYDLHNVLGFYAVIISLVFAITGLIMSFAWFSNAFFVATGGTIKERVISKSDTTLHNILVPLSQVDMAWKKGMTEIGEYNKDAIIVSFPQKASDVIALCVDMRNGVWRYVNLDQHSLEPVASTQKKMKDEEFALYLRRSNYTLHVGAFGGLPVKILFFLASLICASLPVTGFLVWWGKKKKNAKRMPVKRLETQMT